MILVVQYFRLNIFLGRLLALKLLKSQNKLKTLPMMQKETVTVFILGQRQW